MTAQASQSPHEAATFSLAELRREAAKSAHRITAAGVDPLLSAQDVCAALGMGKTKFHELLKADPQVVEHLGTEAVDGMFDDFYHLKHVDHLFERVFGPTISDADCQARSLSQA